jgi:diketogulonate reductase-like aldo/keto reductase
MISVSNIKSIGYGCGFGAAYAREVKYTKKHLEILKFLIQKKNFNFLDTAAEYGNGDSEKLIGKLNCSQKKNIFISTKVSSENLKYNLFINSVKKSLIRLKLKKIDLIQPHWPNSNFDLDEIVEAFKFLKRNKMVRYFGTSNYSLEEIRYFKKKLNKYFKFIQEEFSLVDRSAEYEKLNFVEKHNMKLIGYSPFVTGKFKLSFNQEKVLDYISKKYKASRHQIILNFLKSRSNKIILIPNSFNKKNIELNINSQFLKIAKTDLNDIDKEFKFKTLKIMLKDIYYLDPEYNKIKNIDDAISNRYNFSPSPIELAKKIKKGVILKPIKIKKNSKKYHLVEGRLRFWAHVIAFGWNYKIVAIIKN